MTTADDIFARPPRFARRRVPTPQPTAGMVGRIACAVCGLRAEVLVCRECAETPETSRQRVIGWLGSNMTQALAAFDTWDAFCGPRVEAWDRLRKAEQDPDYAVRCAKARADGNVFGQLLDAHAAYTQAMQPLAIERARLERALEVLKTL